MTNIWVPKAKLIEPKREIVLQTRIAGFWKLEAIRPDGRRRLLADWFRNLITDAGLNEIGEHNQWLSFCRVGTGTNAPNVADTALQAQVASANFTTSASNSFQGSPPYYGSTTRTFRFGQGAAAGNLAEIGIGETTGTVRPIFSRSRILDGSGNPTTITVLSDEFLDATYQIRVYPPLSDVLGTLEITGSGTHDITTRASFVTSLGWAPGGGATIGSRGGINGATVYNGAIGAITTGPSGTNDGATSVTEAAYGANNLYRDGTAIWQLDDGNLSGGIRSLNFSMGLVAVGGAGGMGVMQVELDPVINKTNAQILTLIMRHQWARGSI